MVDNGLNFSAIGAREQMLNAVRDMIFRDKLSFADISVVSICKKANISRSTFYRFYNSRDELIYDMMLNDLNGFEEKIDTIIRCNDTPVNKLRLLQQQLAKTFFEDFTDVVIQHFQQEAPAFWKVNVDRCASILKESSIIVKQGIADGSFKPDTDPNMVVFLLYCCSETNSENGLLLTGGYSRTQLINKIFDIMLGGILSEK